MWENTNKTIKRIESQIDLISITKYLYDYQYCNKDNEDCSLKSSHIIGEFVQMKKLFEFDYGFKSHCTFINKLFLSWNVVFGPDQRLRERHFRHLAMNSYLRQKLFP